jgi:hypothetical protein
MTQSKQPTDEWQPPSAQDEQDDELSKRVPLAEQPSPKTKTASRQKKS